MKSTRLLLVVICFSFLPSCSLLSSALKIPGSILKAAGRTAGIGLTDDASKPVTPEVVKTIEDEAAARKAAAE